MDITDRSDGTDTDAFKISDGSGLDKSISSFGQTDRAKELLGSVETRVSDSPYMNDDGRAMEFSFAWEHPRNSMETRQGQMASDMVREDLQPAIRETVDKQFGVQKDILDSDNVEVLKYDDPNMSNALGLTSPRGDIKISDEQAFFAAAGIKSMNDGVEPSFHSREAIGTVVHESVHHAYFERLKQQSIESGDSTRWESAMQDYAQYGNVEEGTTELITESYMKEMGIPYESRCYTEAKETLVPAYEELLQTSRDDPEFLSKIIELHHENNYREITDKLAVAVAPAGKSDLAKEALISSDLSLVKSLLEQKKAEKGQLSNLGDTSDRV